VTENARHVMMTVAEGVAGLVGGPAMVVAITGADDFGVSVAYARSSEMTSDVGMSCIEAALIQERANIENAGCDCANCQRTLEAIQTCLEAMARLKHGGKMHG
jgi:hypothetical protein